MGDSLLQTEVRDFMVRIYIYRVFHDLWTLLQELISYVFVIKGSYKYLPNFGRLRSYDRLKLRIEGNDY